jgi:hypothetical protein
MNFESPERCNKIIAECFVALRALIKSPGAEQGLQVAAKKKQSINSDCVACVLRLHRK